MAAWLVVPPWSVMIPAARFMIGTQSGSVISVTRMAPSRKRAMSRGSRITQAVPIAIASPIAEPVRSTLPLLLSRYVLSVPAERADCTVSGRAWTRYSSPVSPSCAHSMSMARP